MWMRSPALGVAFGSAPGAGGVARPGRAGALRPAVAHAVDERHDVAAPLVATVGEPDVRVSVTRPCPTSKSMFAARPCAGRGRFGSFCSNCAGLPVASTRAMRLSLMLTVAFSASRLPPANCSRTLRAELPATVLEAELRALALGLASLDLEARLRGRHVAHPTLFEFVSTTHDRASMTSVRSDAGPLGALRGEAASATSGASTANASSVRRSGGNGHAPRILVAGCLASNQRTGRASSPGAVRRRNSRAASSARTAARCRNRAPGSRSAAARAIRRAGRSGARRR